MKTYFLSTLCLLATALIFSAQVRAKDYDFTYDDFACVITSEEDTEVSIYYNYYGDFADRKDFKTYIHYVYDGSDHELKIDRCKEQKLIFPSKVEWNNKSYTVTSILPSKPMTYSKSWIVGITEVELPSTLKVIPDSNPFKYYRDLYRISMPESNEYFTTKNGCLYNADCTTLYAVPCIPDNVTLFKADACLQKIHPEAFFDSLIHNFDFSEAINLEPLNASFFNDFFYIDSFMYDSSIYTDDLYFPPTVIFESNEFECISDIKYHLPSSTNEVTTGFIRGGDRWLNINYYGGYTYSIDTYSNGIENLVIRKGFWCVNNGKKLVAYDTHRIPFSTIIQGDTYEEYYPKKISFPEGIEIVAANLFSDQNAPACVKFTNYIFPSTLKVIEDYAFEGYKGSEIHIEYIPGEGKPHQRGYYENIGKIASRDANGNEIENTLPIGLETMGKGCFIRSMLKEITVPNVKHIPELAFAGCQQLEKITFGAGVEEIELSALFAKTTDPKTNESLITPETCIIEFLSTTPPRMLTTNFKNAWTFNNTVIVPAEAIEEYQKEWGGKFPNILSASGNNAILADDNSADNDSTEVYYNLNGQRVDGDRNSLTPGLYICRKKNNVEKILIK